MARQPMTAFVWVLVAVVAILWVALTADVLGIRQSDAAGRGLSQAFAYLATIALWIGLAILLTVAASRGVMPGWTKAAAILLVPATGAAAFAAIGLLSDSTPPIPQWANLVVSLPPLLMIGWALWGLIPSIQSSIAPTVAGGVVWGVCLALALAPWPLTMARRERGQAQRERVAREYQATKSREEEAARANRSAKLDSVPADAPLWDWLDYLEHPDTRDRALARIHQLARRQGDSETMVSRGYGLAFSELSQLDLTASQALCQASVKFLDQRFASLPEASDPKLPGRILAERIEPYRATIEWLLARGCQLGPTLGRFERAGPDYADDSDRQRFLGWLSQLRR